MRTLHNDIYDDLFCNGEEPFVASSVAAIAFAHERQRREVRKAIDEMKRAGVILVQFKGQDEFHAANKLFDHCKRCADMTRGVSAGSFFLESDGGGFGQFACEDHAPPDAPPLNGTIRGGLRFRTPMDLVRDLGQLPFRTLRYTNKRRSKQMVELFMDNDGKTAGMRTNVSTPEAFVQQLAHSLGAISLPVDGNADGWVVNLTGWLSDAFELMSKLKGYKADEVMEERVLTRNRLAPGITPIVATDERLRPVVNGAARISE